MKRKRNKSKRRKSSSNTKGSVKRSESSKSNIQRQVEEKDLIIESLNKKLCKMKEREVKLMKEINKQRKITDNCLSQINKLKIENQRLKIRSCYEENSTIISYEEQNKENLDANRQYNNTQIEVKDKSLNVNQPKKLYTRASVSSIDSDLPLIMNPLRSTNKASTQTAKFKSTDSQKGKIALISLNKEELCDVIESNFIAGCESLKIPSLEPSDTLSSEKLLNFEFEAFKQHTFKLQKQIDEVKEKQFFSTKQWKEKELRYLKIIESFKNHEFEEWNDTYESLLSKVEVLKTDIENIRTESIDYSDIKEKLDISGNSFN